MKTAIYIEDGTTQLVLTPETDFEKAAVDKLVNGPMAAQVMAGSFYDCRGGWVRQKPFQPSGAYGEQISEDKSIIIRVGEKPKEDLQMDVKKDSREGLPP